MDTLNDYCLMHIFKFTNVKDWLNALEGKLAQTNLDWLKKPLPNIFLLFKNQKYKKIIFENKKIEFTLQHFFYSKIKNITKSFSSMKTINSNRHYFQFAKDGTDFCALFGEACTDSKKLLMKMGKLE